MTKKQVSTYIKSDPLKSTTNQNNVAAILNQLNGFEIEPTTIENLAAAGVSVKNICGLIGKTFSYITDHPELQEAFNRGRANVGSRLRAKILDAALEDNNMPAAIYLDKIYGGETVAQEVNLNVTNTQLSDISTSDLLDVTFETKDHENGEN